MNNQIQTLYFLGQPVRMILDEKQNPWFLAMDVASILEYYNTEAMTKKLDEDEILIRHIDGLGNRGNAIINESGLYSCILTSDKPQAKPFKKWVTSEVLPSIRKYGFYGTQDLLDDKQRLVELYARWDELKKLDRNTKNEIYAIKKELRNIAHKPHDFMTAIPFPNIKSLS